MIRHRQAGVAEGSLRLGRRRAARRMPRRRQGSVKTSGFELPLTSASRSLQRLRGDIEVLVDAAVREPTASRRAALVDVHHQLRLLGQRVNAALGAPTRRAQDAQPQP
ncbi:hypothetical protein AB0873_10980 [Micromonospora sp. NPDC047707]|uniref:hypothetical protein n=1 Tax=Micromonospora sp. NPDC047707 TaxID=3154498 RepID=UPI0034512082